MPAAERLSENKGFKDLSFTLVGCWQNLDLLLRIMVEAEEVIERKR